MLLVRRLGVRVRSRLRGDAGMNSAEYAVGTLAAVTFAGVLIKVVSSDAVQAALNGLITRALA
jgi:hypothetical protein